MYWYVCWYTCLFFFHVRDYSVHRRWDTELNAHLKVAIAMCNNLFCIIYRLHHLELFWRDFLETSFNDSNRNKLPAVAQWIFIFFYNELFSVSSYLCNMGRLLTSWNEYLAYIWWLLIFEHTAHKFIEIEWIKLLNWYLYRIKCLRAKKLHFYWRNNLCSRSRL